MKGQSLFEVIFAIAVAAIILIGVVSIGSSTVRNSTFARNQSLATRQVGEASEWLRSQKDADWTTFVSWASTYPPGTLWCLGAISSGLTAPAPSCNKVPGTTFTREVRLIEESSDIVRAEISVTWTDSNGSHDVRSIARFTDWR